MLNRLAAKRAAFRYQQRLRERAGRIERIERQVRAMEAANPRSGERPVLVFNPTSHITQLTLNGAVSLLLPWSVRITGHPVEYLVCAGALGKCVLGTRPTDTLAPPPCAECRSFTSSVYPAHLVREFPGQLPARPLPFGNSAPLDDLVAYEYRGYDLGRLCVPSTRWVLRRFDFENDPAAPALLASFIQAAMRIVDELELIIARGGAGSLLLFNGVFYPEATARSVALRHGISTVTYESAYLPLSVFLSHGVAPEHAFDIPASFTMSAREEAELDAYLAQRVRGAFTKAGVRYWPTMKELPDDLRARMAAHRQLVTAFTNVVSDTSQGWAHTVFSSMFEWLDEIMETASRTPDTLFVIRAHPDELRPGRESRQTVRAWFERHRDRHLPNVAFIGPTDLVSSYDLMKSSAFCLVYSSTVGIEATLLGVPVVNGGRGRYWREGFTHAPADTVSFRRCVEEFLAGGVPKVPADWIANARRYLYYALYRTSISLAEFITPIDQYDHTLRPFNAGALSPESSREMGIIHAGVFEGKPFHYA